MYQWWVFIHLIGVLVFVAAHGVSMSVLFRLRKERDPQRVNHLLELSSSSITAFYYGLLLLLAGGIVAGFLGHWWGRAWIWAAIGILVLVTLVMYAVATPYYKRVRFVARAMAEGSKAVTPEQFDQVLKGGAPVAVGVVGVLGLVAIVYLMVLKPSLGFSTEAAAPVPSGSGPVVQISAQSLQFHPTDLTAPAGQAFTLVFRNDDAGVPHNVAIYTDSSASSSVFVGDVFSGPATQNYQVPALQAGSYFFRCDVHPQMTGTIKVASQSFDFPVVTPSSSPSG